MMPYVAKAVAFWLPAPAWSYAKQRGDSTHVLLIKHVLAKYGDFVSTLHGELRVNGVRIGAIAAVDPAGRALPHWAHRPCAEATPNCSSARPILAVLTAATSARSTPIR